MNQIICTNSSTLMDISEDIKSNLSKTSLKMRLLKILFYILVLASISITIYYIFFKYDLYKSEKLSKELINNFNISTLYSSSYTSSKIDQELYSSELSSSVIGIIEINKIDITYPILSTINKDFLKIAPCRFYGPNPNETGNLCIAAHNYKNDSFFSNLAKLENGDVITIYDSNSNYVDYIVYSVYTAYSTDLECTSQDTNNLKIITLITCDSINNNYRTIVKAKEF